jgi:hypothetical protein
MLVFPKMEASLGGAQGWRKGAQGSEYGMHMRVRVHTGEIKVPAYDKEGMYRWKKEGRGAHEWKEGSHWSKRGLYIFKEGVYVSKRGAHKS